MNKSELASYLASLSLLLKDQDAAGGHLRSQLLGVEYQKHWDMFKAIMEKEYKSNEAR